MTFGMVDDKKGNIIAAEECGIDAICYQTVNELRKALKERGIEN